MTYKVRNKATNNIRTYRNVAKKYSHTYSYELMVKNISAAYSAIYQIENGLLRRQPTISRWSGFYMATSKDKKWYFAYRIDGDTIYVEDACHAQNMHESRLIYTTRLDKLISESIRHTLRKLL